MSKTFVLKLLKQLSGQAKADGNICRTYDNSAKAEKLKAYTTDMGEKYYNHLMEFSL